MRITWSQWDRSVHQRMSSSLAETSSMWNSSATSRDLHVRGMNHERGHVFGGGGRASRLSGHAGWCFRVHVSVHPLRRGSSARGEGGGEVSTHCAGGGGGGREVVEERRGGGVWNPKGCVQTMAQINQHFLFANFIFFPLYQAEGASLWRSGGVGGGGGGTRGGIVSAAPVAWPVVALVTREL